MNNSVQSKYHTPVVSVIVPSYNRKDTVGQTIDSILSQKCNFDFEIIIGDDCSTDGVRELLLEYQKNHPDIFKLIFHETNVGLAANWASCVKACSGKYIANCDNDDYWHNENKLQLQVDFLEEHPDVGMCHTDYRVHNRDTNSLCEVEASRMSKGGTELQKFIFGSSFKCCNASVMYRADMLTKYVNLDDYIQHQFTLQDWNTWVILAAYVDFCSLPISTATFGIETESITRPKSFEKIEWRMSKERECYKYVCDLFPEIFPYKEDEYNQYIYKVLLSAAFNMKNFRKAKENGKLIHSKNLKVRASQTKFLFYTFILLRKLKNKLNIIFN